MLAVKAAEPSDVTPAAPDHTLQELQRTAAALQVRYGVHPAALIRFGYPEREIVKNEPAQTYRRILVPIDFSADSAAAAALALKIAPDADVTLLHVREMPSASRVPPADSGQGVRSGQRLGTEEDAQAELARLVSSLGADKRSLTCKVVIGLPRQLVREEAEHMRPDLIIVGKHGHSMGDNLLLGSVTRTMVNTPSSDVLVAATPPRRIHP